MEIKYLANLISELPNGTELTYVRSNEKCKFERIDIDEPRVYAVTPPKEDYPNGENVSFGESYLNKMVSKIEPYVPFNISQLMNNSGSNRPVIEAVVAHTKEFYRYTKGRAVFVVWIPSQEHTPGELVDWTDDTVLREPSVSYSNVKTVTKLILTPDEKEYSEDELAEILRRMYNEGEADSSKTANLMLFALKYGGQFTNARALCRKADISLPTPVQDGKRLYQLITEGKYGVTFYSPNVEIELPKVYGKLEETLPLQVIFYGAPGTGKSHTTDSIIADFPNSHQRTTFHPDTDYSSFVGCYKPTKEDNGKLTYTFVPQVFLKAYVEAWRNPALPYFLVIEEINRGNCAQIFGDIFQLLDRDKANGGISKYTITPDEDIRKHLKETFAADDFEHLPDLLRLGERMQLPGNLYILATMNTSDQSLFPIDSAFKRRWAWKYRPIEQGKDDNGKLIEWQIRNGNYAYDWWEFISKINEKVEDATQSEDKKMGFWFTSPENGVGYITQEDFISKVLFYLWNDIYKDYAKTDDTIFKGQPVKAEGATEEPKAYEIFFTHFFRTDGSVENRVRDFMRFNGITEKEFVEPQPENGDAEDDEDGGDDPTENLKYWQNFRELLLTMPLGERIKNYKTPSGSSYQIALPNNAGLTNTFVLARIAPKQNYCRVSVGINGEVQTDILSYLYEQKDAIVAKVQELTGDAPEWYESDSNHIYVNVQRDGLQPEWQAECMQKLYDYFVEVLKGFTPEAHFKTTTGHKVSGDYQNRLDEAMSQNPVLKDAFYRNHGGAYHLNVPGTSDIKIACYNLKDHVSMAVRVDKESPKTLEWVEQNIQTLADALGETPKHETLQSGYHIFVILKPGKIDYSNTEEVNEAIAWHIEKSEAAYNALVKLIETK